MAKKNIIVFCIIFILGSMLWGCVPGTSAPKEGDVSTVESTQAIPEVTAEPASIPQVTESEPLSTVKTTGFRMVSDGDFIYYSQYGEPGLRKISNDLSTEVLLADEDCTYLTLVEDMLYYVVPDSGIWQVKTDGSERKQLEMAEDVSWLSYEDGMLYYLQNYYIYRYDLQSAGESVEELEAQYGAAAESDGDTFFRSEKISDEYCGSLAVGGGHIFYTAAPQDKNSLFMMDIAGGEPIEVASGVGTEIYIDNGRLYYAEQEKISDLDVNTRLCSMDLSGNDRKLYFEEINAGAYFTVVGGVLYFTRYHPGGADNFDGHYLYRIAGSEPEPQALYADYDVSDMLTIAGDYLWFNNFSYDTQITSDYWGKTDGSYAAMLGDLRPEPGRSEYLDPYIEPYGPGESYLSLSTANNSACYKLIRTDGTVEFTEFLEPNTEISVAFPSGRYMLKIAEGSEWLGDDLAFGEEGIYSTTDVYPFDEGYSYEITSGSTGDFSTDSLDGFLD